MNQPVSNFEFLKEHDPIFFELARSAEQVFASDPNTTLIKLRQLGEAFAQDIAARCGIAFDDLTPQADLIHQIDRELRLDPTIRNLFHTIRVEVNKATHEFKTDHKEALNGLKLARSLAIWYHQSFGKASGDFNPGTFITPEDPSQKLRELQNKISQLNAKKEKLEDNQQLINLLKKEKQEYAQLAEQMDKEAQTLAQQLKTQENTLQKQRESFETHIKLLQLELTEQAKNNPQKSSQQQLVISEKVKEANKQIFLTEELVRLIIDQQLVDAGWMADSLELTWDNGILPEEGKYKAIANYPLFYQGNAFYADYILFYELIPIAIIEAKCENINVAEKIRQAKTYAESFKVEPLMQAPWLLKNRTKPWHYHNTSYNIPFVYSSNGRPYNGQLEEKSGTWFRDIREPSNLSMALQHFHSPEGLYNKLTHDKVTAEQALQLDNFSGLFLRDYQKKAVSAIENALSNNHNNCLVAMTTGTGKTFVINALIYRFLKTKRFNRILVLVDHTALGLQTEDLLIKAPQDQQTILAKLYKLETLNYQLDDLEKHVQLATVQQMIKTIFASDSPHPIDYFDCVIIDEAHSGYALEQEFIEGELATRNSEQYLKEYQQLLNYFDAFKVGLTATPVKRTTDFFNLPVYQYSYREAIADGYLIDYEPPIIYKTKLTEQPLCFNKGSTIQIINAITGDIEEVTLEDDLIAEANALNRSILNKHFNEVICQQLIDELNPFGQEKTLIFCASDLHADMVKNLLDNAFTNLYENSYDQLAVAKITANSYNPEELIDRFKTAQYPNIAITVDLLATAVDIPQVCNLVFLRAINSRILLEQMLARASLPCESIQKASFRIYDAFNTHNLLTNITQMESMPAPELPLTSLLQLFIDNRQPNDEQLQAILDHCIPILRRANYQAQQDTFLKAKLDSLTSSCGVAPQNLTTYLQSIGTKKAAVFFKNRKNFIQDIQAINQQLDSSRYQIISDSPDQLTQRLLCYGNYSSPKELLDACKAFITEQRQHSKSLNKSIEKPNQVTRFELKEIKLLLGHAGFTELNLQIAWRNINHRVVNAGLIGFIRHISLGEPLISFEYRVNKTLQEVQAMNTWTPIQRQWLDRIAEHFIEQEILDKKQLNNELKQRYNSSIEKLDTLLNNQLNSVISALKTLWVEKVVVIPQEPEIQAPEETIKEQPISLSPTTTKKISFFQRIRNLIKPKL